MRKSAIACIGILILLGVGISFGYYKKMMQTKPANAPLNPTAKIIFNTGESFTIELYPECAPNTVANFISLSKQGFYKQTQVNRIVPGYLIQAGDPIGNGHGFPGYFIKSECKYNGFSNPIKHTKGTVSMARGESFNTEGSQFFVLLRDSGDLNGQFSAFARVIEGIEVAEKIGNKGVNGKYVPIHPLWIEDIVLELRGYEEQMPEVMSVKEQRMCYESK